MGTWERKRAPETMEDGPKICIYFVFLAFFFFFSFICYFGVIFSQNFYTARREIAASYGVRNLASSLEVSFQGFTKIPFCFLGRYSYINFVSLVYFVSLQLLTAKIWLLFNPKKRPLKGLLFFFYPMKINIIFLLCCQIFYIKLKHKIK